MTDPEHAATLTRPGDKIGRATPGSLTPRPASAPAGGLSSDLASHTQFCVMTETPATRTVGEVIRRRTFVTNRIDVT
jgi:hypothetical protein